MPRAARVLTALAVIIVCAFAVARGWSIVSFAHSRARASQEHADGLRAWRTTTGLAGFAIAASLTEVADAADTASIRKRTDDLTDVLSVRPLSSMSWLSLAGMRLVRAEPFEKVLGALELSSLTGANEGSLMLQRGIFGLLQWEILPPKVRTRVIADLAGVLAGTMVGDEEFGPAKTVLAVKTAETREEIADRLREDGVPARELARMGL